VEDVEKIFRILYEVEKITGTSFATHPVKTM